MTQSAGNGRSRPPPEDVGLGPGASGFSGSSQLHRSRPNFTLDSLDRAKQGPKTKRERSPDGGRDFQHLCVLRRPRPPQPGRLLGQAFPGPGLRGRQRVPRPGLRRPHELGPVRRPDGNYYNNSPLEIDANVAF